MENAEQLSGIGALFVSFVWNLNGTLPRNCGSHHVGLTVLDLFIYYFGEGGAGGRSESLLLHFSGFFSNSQHSLMHT